MTSDEIAKTFSGFFKTSGDLSSFLSFVTTLAEIRKLDFRLDDLTARRTAAQIPFENERIDLGNQRAKLVGDLNKIIL